MSSKKKKVIIIGAGIAGLAAAKQLFEYDCEVLVLEARAHYGGRIYCEQFEGIPLGYGASWIHGDQGNPIAQLADQFKVERVPVDPEKFYIFDRKGNTIKKSELDHFNQKFSGFLSKAKKLAFSSKRDLSLAAALSKVMANERLNELEQDLFGHKSRYFENYLGSNEEQLSARYWDIEEPMPGNNCYLSSSYQPLIDGLAKSCPIQFNTIVSQINTSKHEIEIVSGQTVFYADAVLVTVPLGVLKKNSLAFTPPCHFINKMQFSA